MSEGVLSGPRHTALLAALVAALLAPGCSSLGAGGAAAPNRGAAQGPAVEGVVVARGRLLGGLEQGNPGLVLGEDAAGAAERAGREALTVPIGGRTSWEDAASGVRGSFTALRDYTSAAGSYCREILPRIVAPSGVYTGSTLVCRRTDGRWYVLD